MYISVPIYGQKYPAEQFGSLMDGQFDFRISGRYNLAEQFIFLEIWRDLM